MDIERKGHILVQHLATGRKQARAESGSIARAMCDTFNAQLTVFHFDHQRRILQADKRGILDARLHQPLREFCADAGAGTVVVNAGIDNAKAVFCYGGVQRCGKLRARLYALRQTQRTDHVPSAIGILKRAGQQIQRVHLILRCGCTQVGVDGGRHRILL